MISRKSTIEAWALLTSSLIALPEHNSDCGHQGENDSCRRLGTPPGPPEPVLKLRNAFEESLTGESVIDCFSRNAS